MATTFDSHFASVGFPLLLEQFGESVTYHPAAGGSRPIVAIVDRDPPAIFDASGNAIFPRFTIRVYNSCRSGIASKELDTGKDAVTMARNIDDRTPQRCSVGQIVSQDSGVTHFTLI